MGKVVLKQDSQNRKTKGHHGKAKGQNQKANVLHGKDQAQASKRIFFSLSPTPFKKYKPTFSPNVPSFRDFLSCFSQNLPTRTNSHSILRAGHALTRIYAHAHSANLPFLPSRFTSPRNKLYISRLSVKTNPAFTYTFTATTCNSTPCTTSITKTGEGKRVKPSHVTHNQSTPYPKKGEEVKAKIEKH